MLKCMMRRYGEIGLLTALGLLAWPAHVAAVLPELPGESFNDSSPAILVLDAAKVTPKDLRAAAKAVFAENADAMDEPIRELEKRYDKFVAAGLTALAMSGESGREEGFTLFLGLKDEGSEAALKKLIADDADLQRGFDDSAPAKVGSWLMMTHIYSKAPAAGSAERQKTMKALVAKAGDSGAALIFLATDNLKAEFAQIPVDAMPPGMYSFVKSIVESQGLVTTFKADDKPALSMVLSLKNADAAKAWVDGFAKSMDQIKAGIAEAKKGNPNHLEMPDAMEPMYAALAMLDPKADGADVKAIMDDKVLAVMGKVLGTLRNAKQRANLAVAMSQCRSIGVTAQVGAANSKDGKYPEDLGTLCADAEAFPMGARMLIMPTAKEIAPEDWGSWDAKKKAQWINANSSYVYLGRGKTMKDLDAKVILVYLKPELAIGGKIAVVYMDCYAETLPAEEAMKKVKAQEEK